MWSGSEDLSEISCDEVLHEIEHYLHGELGQQQSSRLATHLEECSPCLERAEFQRKLKEIVRDKCRCETPEHVVLRIQQAIRLEGEFE
jgi:mycothiol system anti-sigma-R factor